LLFCKDDIGDGIWFGVFCYDGNSVDKMSDEKELVSLGQVVRKLHSEA
jgi:hypothetical protein